MKNTFKKTRSAITLKKKHQCTYTQKHQMKTY